MVLVGPVGAVKYKRDHINSRQKAALMTTLPFAVGFEVLLQYSGNVAQRDVSLVFCFPAGVLLVVGDEAENVVALRCIYAYDFSA